MRAFALIIALAALSACSGEDSGAASADASADASGGGDYHSAAQCSAKMEAVSALYAAIASSSSGDTATQMRETADLRATAARVLKAKAEEYAGDASGEVATIIAETREMIEANQESMAFEDFASWVGKEADGCAPMVQAIVQGE